MAFPRLFGRLLLLVAATGLLILIGTLLEATSNGSVLKDFVPLEKLPSSYWKGSKPAVDVSSDPAANSNKGTKETLEIADPSSSSSPGGKNKPPIKNPTFPEFPACKEWCRNMCYGTCGLNAFRAHCGGQATRCRAERKDFENL